MKALWREVSAGRLTGIVAVILTILAVVLHVMFGTHAGALWRDEANSLNLAMVHTISEIWPNLDYDSFPALYFIVLRLFASVVGIPSDAELRLFGVIVGVAVLGMIWLNARWLRLGFPLLTLALVGLNPMVIRYGDSVRAYGLGIVLMLLVFGTMWRLVERWTVSRAALAAITAILSVQCLYYNSIFLFAVCLGGCAVTLHRRAWRETVGILSIGTTAAVSLLPYLPTIFRVQKWSSIWKTDFTWPLLWEKLSEVLGAPISPVAWIWVIFLSLSIAVGVRTLWRARSRPDEERDISRVLFALVTLIIGTACYIGFLQVLSYVTQPWYYIVLAALTATCFEAITTSASPKRWLLGARTAFAVTFASVVFLPALGSVQSRQTNVDAVAARIESLAGRDDLILINTWNFGISFQRYYNGQVLCAPVPLMKDLRFHRMDLYMGQMRSGQAMIPIYEEVEKTLRRGHAVWLVGTVDFLPPDRQPLQGNYEAAWSEQLGVFVQTHVINLARVRVPMQRKVSDYENLPLSIFQGWK